MFCAHEAFKLLGFVLDPKKSQPPSTTASVLGVMFNCAALSHERLLTVEPKPTRLKNSLSLVDKVIQDNYLPPSLAASLLGKFDFLCTTLFGKVGRSCTHALRLRL